MRFREMYVIVDKNGNYFGGTTTPAWSFNLREATKFGTATQAARKMVMENLGQHSIVEIVEEVSWKAVGPV
jgi:hypothetical protein